MTTFICYSKCSTCKKAQAWLDAHGIAYTVRDIKEARPTAEELRLWSERSGLHPSRFFNTSGLLYRALQLKDQLPRLSTEELFTVLASDGMLVKRPILLTEDKVLLGFRPDAWEETLLGDSAQA